MGQDRIEERQREGEEKKERKQKRSEKGNEKEKKGRMEPSDRNYSIKVARRKNYSFLSRR